MMKITVHFESQERLQGHNKFTANETTAKESTINRKYYSR